MQDVELPMHRQHGWNKARMFVCTDLPKLFGIIFAFWNVFDLQHWDKLIILVLNSVVDHLLSLFRKTVTSAECTGSSQPVYQWPWKVSSSSQPSEQLAGCWYILCYRPTRDVLSSRSFWRSVANFFSSDKICSRSRFCVSISFSLFKKSYSAAHRPNVVQAKHIPA